MRKRISIILSAVLALMPFLQAIPAQAQGQNPPSNQSFVGGSFIARNYSYPGVAISPGVNNAAGAATIRLQTAGVRLQDGRTIMPFSAGGLTILGQTGSFPAIPITVGAGTTKETVTPTAVSGCFLGAPAGNCSITATFTNAHGQGEIVTSGSLGIQEAINDAAFFGGGVVQVDSSLAQMGGSDAAIQALEVAAKPMWNVSLADTLNGSLTYWNPQGGATTLAAPATLTAATAVPSATPVGAYTTGTYHILIAYVDAQGQEGPSSADFSEAGLATGSFVFTTPAASAGAVGYTIYIGLTGGAAGTVYKVPLVSQPAAVGTYPASNSVCTLTTVETITPACAVTNTNYGQTGSTATVTALTLNTSPIAPQVTTISTTSIYVPNAGGRTTFIYTPNTHLGSGGTISSTLAYTISAAAGTTVPAVVGTVNIAPQFMNLVGKTIEICGEATSTATAATIEDIQFQWDSMGQNTAGKGVLIGDLSVTNTLATTGHLEFCQDFQTTAVGATATGGSINHIGGYINSAGLTVAAAAGGGDVVTPGTITSLNLAVDARINIIYLHTTATDGAGWILQHVSAKVI